MKIEEVQFKLISEVQALPPELALEFCNKALIDIYKERSWGFLYERGFIKTPALINTGTVEVTKNSTSVTVSAGLKAILDDISDVDVPLIGRQFRTFGGQIAGPEFWYTIKEYNSDDSELIITPEYQDATNSAAQYQIFKAYYTPPRLIETTVNPVDPFDEIITFDGIDFAYFEFVYAPYHRRKLILDRTRADLDRMDFARQVHGDPNYIVGYGKDSSGNTLFELYPIPSIERTLQVLYKKGNRILKSEESIPSSLNYDLVLVKAKIKAYEWLAINAANVGFKINPNILMNSIAMLSNPNMENSYPRLLAQAILEDENLHPQDLISMGEAPYYDCEPEVILLDF